MYRKICASVQLLLSDVNVCGIFYDMRVKETGRVGVHAFAEVNAFQAGN